MKKINFAKYSSIKIGQEIEVKVLENCSDWNDNYFLLGSCNNTIIGNNPPALIVLSKKFDYIKIENDMLKIGGVTPSGKIASFCKKNNIANFEFISHLPGTLGGLVYMNAGLKEFEIFNHLISIETCNGTKQKNNIKYGYRYTNITTPILEATFKLEYGFEVQKVEMFKKMRANQPKEPSAGSCFKNPHADFAGRLIQEVGLKGYRVGGMEFSNIHANFLVNIDKGTFVDAITLIQEAQKRVKEKFNISLELEVQILDKDFKY